MIRVTGQFDDTNKQTNKVSQIPPRVIRFCCDYWIHPLDQPIAREYVLTVAKPKSEMAASEPMAGFLMATPPSPLHHLEEEVEPAADRRCS